MMKNSLVAAWTVFIAGIAGIISGISVPISATEFYVGCAMLGVSATALVCIDLSVKKNKEGKSA